MNLCSMYYICILCLLEPLEKDAHHYIQVPISMLFFARICGRVNRREACTKVLEVVEQGMRGTIITASDSASLQLVYTARRLFQREDRTPTPSQKMDLTRRYEHDIFPMYVQLSSSFTSCKVLALYKNVFKINICVSYTLIFFPLSKNN